MKKYLALVPCINDKDQTIRQILDAGRFTMRLHPNGKIYRSRAVALRYANNKLCYVDYADPANDDSDVSVNHGRGATLVVDPDLLMPGEAEGNPQLEAEFYDRLLQIAAQRLQALEARMKDDTKPAAKPPRKRRVRSSS